MAGLKRFLGVYFRLSRPIYWPLALMSVFIGFLAGIGPLGEHILELIPKLTVTSVAIILLCSSQYSLNQIFDVKTDRKAFRNKKKDSMVGNAGLPLVKKEITKRNAFIFSIITGLFSLALGFFLGIGVIISALLVLGVLYSVPPFKLKGRAPFDMVSNALAFGTLFPLVGYYITGGILYASAYFLCLIGLLMTSGVYITTTMCDYRSDKAAKIRTFAVRYGTRKSAEYSTYFLVAALFLSFVMPAEFKFLAIIFLPPLIHFLLSNISVIKNPSEKNIIINYMKTFKFGLIYIPLAIIFIFLSY